MPTIKCSIVLKARDKLCTTWNELLEEKMCYANPYVAAPSLCGNMKALLLCSSLEEENTILFIGCCRLHGNAFL